MTNNLCLGVYIYAKSGCGLTLNAKDNTIVRSIKVNLSFVGM